MTTTTTSPNVGQELLAILEGQALVAFGPNLLAFLTAVQAANGDPIKLALAWNALTANLIASAPTALGGLEGQLASIVSSQVSSFLSAAEAAEQVAVTGLSAASVPAGS